MNGAIIAYSITVAPLRWGGYRSIKLAYKLNIQIQIPQYLSGMQARYCAPATATNINRNQHKESYRFAAAATVSSSTGTCSCSSETRSRR